MEKIETEHSSEARCGPLNRQSAVGYGMSVGREIKERIKKTKDEKKAKKAEVVTKTKAGGKAAAPRPAKGPKNTGAGGKR